MGTRLNDDHTSWRLSLLFGFYDSEWVPSISKGGSQWCSLTGLGSIKVSVVDGPFPVADAEIADTGQSPLLYLWER